MSSYNSWKFLNQLKDTVSKISPDKALQNDLFQIFTRIPQSFDFNEYIKQGEKRLVSLQRSVQEMVTRKQIDTQKQQKEKTKWKSTDRNNGSKSLDISKVDNIIDALKVPSGDELLIDQVEDLINHLMQHPEIRNKAIQLGAISLLLSKKSKTTNCSAKECIREALTILGYSEPVNGRGIRILSMDGGGIRGVLVLEMLKKLEELTGKRTYELFDLICGVSTGAILTYSMGVHLRKLEEISIRYEALGQEIFKQSPLRGTSNLVWSHAYYDTVLWEKKLKEYLGHQTLISTSRNEKSPKLCAVSAVVNQSQVSAYVFRNYALPWRIQSQYGGTYDAEVWQAARASAAAPTYFEEFRIRNLIHQDGGILVNNPTAIAIHEAKLLWPNTPIQCVVSFGTGRSVPSPNEVKSQNTEIGSEGTSWTNKFYKILDSATDTQAVHIMLSDLLPHDVYYRFNPYLTEVIGMVETDQEKLIQLKRDALMYLRRNEDKFQQAAKTLTLEKTAFQKIADTVNFQKCKLGL